MSDQLHELLDFWFGPLGSADLPTSDRTQLWFGEQAVIRQQLLARFSPLYQAAVTHELSKWVDIPRGRLALIILFDQFTRYIHHHSPQAFSFDAEALALCEK